MDDVDFSYALRALKSGLRVTRAGWPLGSYVAMAFGDTRLTMPFFYVVTPHGQSAPWTPNHSDLVVEDWAIV